MFVYLKYFSYLQIYSSGYRTTGQIMSQTRWLQDPRAQFWWKTSLFITKKETIVLYGDKNSIYLLIKKRTFSQ